MTREIAKQIVKGITDKIECNTTDIDDWAEFWGFTREEYEEFLDMPIEALEQEPTDESLHREREQAYMQGYEDASKRFRQEPCDDCISRKSIKQKLQEHHDFFVNAYGGFSNLPLNDKSRVDEISNCIAEVLNEPSVIPQEPSRDLEEIEEVINCDADAETKCKMISNILTAKPHYFKEPQESE